MVKLPRLGAMTSDVLQEVEVGAGGGEDMPGSVLRSSPFIQGMNMGTSSPSPL